MSTSLGSSLIGAEFIDSNPKAPRFITNGRSTGPEMRIVGNGIDTRLSSKLADVVDKKVEASRQKDLARYGELLRQSVDSKLSPKLMDELATIVLRLGFRPESVDEDAANYREWKQYTGRDLKAESSEAQKVLFEAVEKLRRIEREEIPALRKVISIARGRNQQASYERQRLEIIEKSKPWLIPAPAEVETK